MVTPETVQEQLPDWETSVTKFRQGQQVNLVHRVQRVIACRRLTLHDPHVYKHEFFSGVWDYFEDELVSYIAHKQHGFTAGKYRYVRESDVDEKREVNYVYTGERTGWGRNRHRRSQLVRIVN